MSEFDEILAKQLQMNEHIWKTLLEHGFSENNETRLDFTYYAKDKELIEALHKYLFENTDYDLNISQPQKANEFYALSGSTQPTKITKESRIVGSIGWSRPVFSFTANLTGGGRKSLKANFRCVE